MPYPTWLPILLGFLSATGPLSTDMYLPAFPAIESSLGGRPGTAQITLATWFAGLAIGQVTQGSLADRFGRRRPLIIGTLVFTIANAGCALAPDLTTLSLMRFIAAFGGSASMVIPRAIIRDLADGHAAARLMSRLMLVMGAAPILAPTLGGLILGFAPWHAIFWFTTVYGGICCTLVWAFMPDTMQAAHRARLSFGGVAARYASILRDRIFLAYALAGGFAMFGMFAYIGGSSPVFIEHFHFTPPQFGMVFGLGASMFILGTQLNPRLLQRFGAPRMIRAALLVYVASSALMLLLALLGRGGPAAIIVPIMVSLGSMGLTIPNTTVGALSRHAARAGSASALTGTIQFSLAALSGILVGLLTDGTPRPMAAIMFGGAVCAFTIDAMRPRSLP